MTVSSTTNSETFACNGVTTVFVAPFRVLEASAVHCSIITIATGESAPLTNGVHFTVSGVGSANTNVTTAIAYSALYSLHVKRITERLQETDYRDNDPFPAESHETGLDRLTYIVQEDAAALSRALLWPDGETAPTMPSKAERANKLWANNNVGDLVFLSSGAGGDFSLRGDLASPVDGYGDSLLSVKHPASAVERTQHDKNIEVCTLADFASVGAAITAATAGNFTVGVAADVTVQIPTDAATLQIALDRLYPLNNKVQITLNIASGHVLSTGVTLAARDCRQFRITSTDAEVPVSAGYAVTVFVGTNGAFLPRIACLVNAANQVSLNGVSVNTGACAVIEAGKGVKNVWGTGLLAVGAGYVAADGANFTGAARNGTTGAGITAWGCVVTAEGADVSGSGYYGAQAAHGGALAFRLGTANGCARHGVRATDAAVVDADAATVNNCGGGAAGYSICAYMAGVINFVNGSATGSLGTAALFAYGVGSAVNANGATVTGAAGVGVLVQRGGEINVIDGTVSGSGTRDYLNEGGHIYRTDGVPSGAPNDPQQITITGGNISFYPSPKGVTFLRVNTEGGAATDDLDTLTPLSPYTVAHGHLVYIVSVTGANVPSIRDRSVSGDVGNFAFETIGNASVTLSNSVQVAAFMYITGSVWVQVSFAGN